MMLPMSSTFPVACSWCLWTLLSLCYGLEFRYHNSVEIEKYLREVNRNYPAITHRYSIGKSVEGKGFCLCFSQANRHIDEMSDLTASTYSFSEQLVHLVSYFKGVPESDLTN